VNDPVGGTERQLSIDRDVRAGEERWDSDGDRRGIRDAAAGDQAKNTSWTDSNQLVGPGRPRCLSGVDDCILIRRQIYGERCGLSWR